MRAVQFYVIVSIWGTVSVGLEGIHVPTIWKSDQNGNIRRNLVQDNQLQNLANPVPVKNEQAKPQIQVFTVYNPFLTNFPDNPFLGPTSKPVTYFQPQSAQIVPPLVGSKSDLPPLHYPRHLSGVQTVTDRYQRRSDQKQPRKHYLKVQNQEPSPSNILRIKPAILGHSDVGLITTNFNDGIFKEYPQKVRPSLPNLQLPNYQLGSISGGQPLKFIVPASDHDTVLDPLGLQLKQGLEPIELTTKNEPVFFVTEGYRNVLVQGSNKNKKYAGIPAQKKAESKKFFNKKGVNDNDEKEISRRNGNEAASLGKHSLRLESNEPKKHDFAGDGQKSRAADFEVKNYRDDSFHEPQAVDWETERETEDDEKLTDDHEDDDDKHKLKSDDEEEEYDEDENETEEEPDEQEEKDETDPELKLPDNEHAEPKSIPTKPIYPGEGLWAKPNLKHRPHISQHRFIQPVETGIKPDGHDVFEDLQEYFNNRNINLEQSFGKKGDQLTNKPNFNNYIQAIKSPKPVIELVTYNPFTEFTNLNSQNPYNFIPNAVVPNTNNININGVYGTIGNANAHIPFHLVPNTVAPPGNNNNNNNANLNDHNEDGGDGEESDEDETEDFVPVRVYAQVRNSEDVKHEPRKPDEDGRLKEVIKDSKVQTVYSEEGYEDSAYDHAGQEKKAEEDQDYLAFQKKKEERGKPETTTGKDSDARHSKKVHHSETVTPLADSIAADSLVSINTTKIFEDGNKTSEAKSNGDADLEIESEVKVFVQPNNTTRAHKYVKIYPKEIKELLENEESKQVTVNSTEAADNHNKSAFTSEESRIAVKTLDQDGGELSRKKRDAEGGPEVESIDISFIDKINHTFAPPKPPEGLNEEKYPYYNKPEINPESPLRYAENMKNVPLKRPGELSFYKKADKFACPELVQDINPIPEHVKNKHDKKTEGDEDDEESDEDEENEREFPNPPNTPRIELGDKIDCLKLRYFGDNPLDSPLFKEKTVGPVKSIFNELDHQANQIKNIKSIDKPKGEQNSDTAAAATGIAHSASSKVSTKLRPNSLFNFENENAESIRSNKKVIQPESSRNGIRTETKATPPSVVTLITTPRYTIKLTPNNIYDQIKLLDHLPEDDDGHRKETTTKRLETTTAKKRREPTTKRIETTTRRGTTTRPVEKTTTKPPDKIAVKRKPKIVEKVTTERVVVTKTPPKEASSKRQPKIAKPEKREIEEKKEVAKTQDPIVLEPEALRRRRVRPKQPLYQIFDVNKFLTTTPFTLIGAASNTVLPKYKVMSEVFYKDEIKPSEQLNVFADVLNNIKDSSRLEAEPDVAASNFGEPNTVTISYFDNSATIPSAVRVKKFQTDSTNQKNTFQDDQLPAEKPYREEHHYSKDNPDITNQITPNIASTHPPIGILKTNRNILKKRRKPTISPTSTTSRTNIQVPTQVVPSNHQPYVIDVIDDSNDIVGLVPPANHHYRTIVLNDPKVTSETPEEVQATIPEAATERILHKHPAPVSEASNEVPPTRSMNKYYFLGLKPPAHQRAKPYSEFSNNNIQINDKLLRKRVAHVGLSRTRRYASRPAYAELSRNRGKQDKDIEKGALVSDDFDDYVPHRPINFHYDEKIGRIVYHSKPEESKPEEEEEEYEEIEIQETPGVYLERAEDATHPSPEKVTTKELLATATPPPEGKGLLDFVVKLKNNPGYQYIPDPTTKKPESATAATEAFVTVNPKSTDPPPFLSILSKVKSDKDYKHIEDPKESESKTKSKSTTPEPEIEEESGDEEENIESSSGKTHSRKVRQTNFNIFNIGSFLPKIHIPIIITTTTTTTTTTTSRPTNILKQHVVGGLSPRQTTTNDITREYHRQVALYKYIKKRIQNAPGGQNQNLGTLQIFDIGDYLPKIKTIVPKTSIDYSRYKTIERPHIRNNNADEGTNVQETKEEPVGRPPAQTEQTQTVPRPETTVTAAAPGTTQRIVQLRRGTRPTTQSIIDETSGSTESAAATRRIVNRKRPLPSGFRGTKRPTVAAEVTQATEQVERIYPQNHSTEQTQVGSHDAARRVYRKRPVRIRHTTERDEENEETVDRITRSLEDGHLATSDNEDEAETGRNNRSTEEIKKRRKREILAESSATVIEIINKDYNRTQQHGGNYKEENDEEDGDKREQATRINSDESKMMFPEEQERVEGKDAPESSSNIKDSVIIINENYDKNKKHADYYKKEPEEEEGEKEAADEGIEEETETINKKGSVAVKNENYDRNEKEEQEEEEAANDRIIEPPERSNRKDNVAIIEGDNYKKDHEEEDIDSDSNKQETVVIENNNKTKNEEVNHQGVEERTENSNKREIINENYDKTKKHGGNYKKESEEGTDRIDEITEGSSKEEGVLIANENYDKPDYKKEYNKEDIEEATENSNKRDSVVIVNKDYDKRQKHGGNYKREYDNEEIIYEPTEEVIEHRNKKDGILIMNENYDKTQKHGGNYRKDYDEEETNRENIEEVTESNNPKDSVVIMNKNYNKTTKHGGNYKKEYDEEKTDRDGIEERTESSNKKDQNYDSKYKGKRDKMIIGDLEATDSSDKDSVVIVNEKVDKDGKEEAVNNDKIAEVTESSNRKQSVIITNENKDKIRMLNANNTKQQNERETKGTGIENENKRDDVQVIDKNYDKTQKHGGNYKNERIIKEKLADKIKQKDIVEIINENYDKTRKHGGNYKKQQEIIESNNGHNKKHFSEDSKNDDQAQIINEDYDKNEKQSNFEDNNKEEKEIEEIINKMFDKSKTHGSYYNEQKEGEIKGKFLEDVSENSKKKDDIEIINDDYDKTKKHGGNFKKNPEEKLSKIFRHDDGKKNDDVEIIDKNYDKTKKHGGNYKNKQEDKLYKSVRSDYSEKKDDVEIINENYDKTKKHGGNYRKEPEETTTGKLGSTGEKGYDKSEKSSDSLKEKHEEEKVDNDTPDAIIKDGKGFYKQPDVFHGKLASESNTRPVIEVLDQEAVEDIAISVDAPQPVEAIIEETLDKSPETPQIRVPRSKPLPRLSDIVPKPDHFYSDPQLPKQVNNLGLEKPPTRLASEEVAEVVARGDSAASKEVDLNVRRRSFVKDEDKTTSTKKPIFIKDPGKRLYFYAKV